MSDNHEQFNIDDAIKALPLEEKVSVVALKKLLDQRQKIDIQQQNKIQQTKKKYYQQIKPLLARASQILKGSPLQAQEYAGAQQLLGASDKLQSLVGGSKIDGYWNGVLSNSSIVDLVNEEDQKALQYLINIEQIENTEKDTESYELLFTFKTNPYFKEQSLKRKLIFQEGTVICLEGDKINWKDGKCLTHILKTTTNKKTGQKTVTKGKPIQSFFKIFLDWDSSSPNQLSFASGIMSQLYNLVVSNHIDYFLGLVNADEESDEDDDEDIEIQEEQQQ